jgi:hypothetical protein
LVKRNKEIVWPAKMSAKILFDLTSRAEKTASKKAGLNHEKILVFAIKINPNLIQCFCLSVFIVTFLDWENHTRWK